MGLDVNLGRPIWPEVMEVALAIWCDRKSWRLRELDNFLFAIVYKQRDFGVHFSFGLEVEASLKKNKVSFKIKFTSLLLIF